MPSNGPDRLTATGSVRARYWRDALNVWSHDVVLGAGAALPDCARPRAQGRDRVQHAHGYVVQTLADLGPWGCCSRWPRWWRG